MGQPTTEAIDGASILQRVRESVSPALSYAAGMLGSRDVAVLYSEGHGFEITDLCSSSGERGLSETSIDPTESLRRALAEGVESAEAGCALAHDLRNSVAPASRSFLLFHWQIRRRAVTVVFGFASSTPPPRISNRAADIASLVASTTWSIKEVGRLRGELETVNNRLAERKLIERAKGLLQKERGFNEEQAYEYMRGISRRRRMTLGALAEEVLRSANGAAAGRQSGTETADSSGGALNAATVLREFSGNRVVSDPPRSLLCAREL